MANFIRQNKSLLIHSSKYVVTSLRCNFLILCPGCLHKIKAAGTEILDSFSGLKSIGALIKDFKFYENLPISSFSWITSVFIYTHLTNKYRRNVRVSLERLSSNFHLRKY